MEGAVPEPSWNQCHHLMKVMQDSNTRARRTGSILESLWSVVCEPETVGKVLSDGGLDDHTLFYECLEAMSEMYHVLIETRASYFDEMGAVQRLIRNYLLDSVEKTIYLFYSADRCCCSCRSPLQKKCSKVTSVVYVCLLIFDVHV